MCVCGYMAVDVTFNFFNSGSANESLRLLFCYACYMDFVVKLTLVIYVGSKATFLRLLTCKLDLV